jgi:mannose-6-phosphate isomerase-like protein (cupin superfamily)
MKRFAPIFLLFAFYPGKAQSYVLNADTAGKNSKTENIYNRALFGDSLASSFCIVIKKEVKAHRHALHSEHVVVMEGEGMMKVSDKNFAIKKGDVVFIPKNEVHSVKVTGKTPLKVISIQSPMFDGKDRIMVEEK